MCCLFLDFSNKKHECENEKKSFLNKTKFSISEMYAFIMLLFNGNPCSVSYQQPIFYGQTLYLQPQMLQDGIIDLALMWSNGTVLLFDLTVSQPTYFNLNFLFNRRNTLSDMGHKSMGFPSFQRLLSGKRKTNISASIAARKYIRLRYSDAIAFIFFVHNFRNHHKMLNWTIAWRGQW